MYDQIVAGTDLSNTARIATDRAAMLADRLGAKLTLIHVGSQSDDVEALAKEYGADVVVKSGNPADVLVEEAERLGAGLLVVGSVGMSGTRRFMLGNVPNKVSHQSPSDLLIVKTDRSGSDQARNYDKILVGTDGSPTSMKAIDLASDLAKALGATTTIVCAYEPPTKQELESYRADPNDVIAAWSAGSSSVPEEFRWRIAGAAQAEDVLERAADHAAKHGIDAEVRAEKGHPAEVLLSLAEDEGFDAIVVGNVGMRGASRFKLGNVPHKISHHAPTDVLILRTS